MGLGSSIVALGIGCTLAFLAARTNVPGRKMIYCFGIAPLFLPSLVGALAWALLGGPASGYLNVALPRVGLPGLINVYSFGRDDLRARPVLRPVHVPDGALCAVPDEPRPRGRRQPARRPLTKMLRTITFPLVMPAIVGSGILVFALTIENFAGGAGDRRPGQMDTLPTLIYRLMNASPSRANECRSCHRGCAHRAAR